jgi:hypothetical protein
MTVFAEVAGLIAAARQRALQFVNTALIDLYWQVGEFIRHKIESAGWALELWSTGPHIAQSQPGQRGFPRPDLFRIKQFHGRTGTTKLSRHWRDNCAANTFAGPGTASALQTCR